MQTLCATLSLETHISLAGLFQRRVIIFSYAGGEASAVYSGFGELEEEEEMRCCR